MLGDHACSMLLLVHGRDRTLAILVMVIDDGGIHPHISMHHRELVESCIDAVSRTQVVVGLELLTASLLGRRDHACLVVHILVV